MNEEQKPYSPEPTPPEETPRAEDIPSPAPDVTAPPPPPVEDQAEEAAGDPREVEEGKVFAILSYALSIIWLPFFLVPLIMRNNEFSLFHAKQNLMIWLAGIVLGIASGVLSVVCVGIVLGLVSVVFLLVLEIIGIMNAAKGEMKPLPVIGQWGVDWFKGLQKV